jgi:hypothetical protein
MLPRLGVSNKPEAPASLVDGCPRIPMPRRESKNAAVGVIEMHLFHGLGRTRGKSNASHCGCDGWWPQFRDQPQDIGEQSSRNGDLGHLEGDVTAVADDLRADLNQLLLQARQRPVLTWGGPGQGDSVAHK